MDESRAIVTCLGGGPEVVRRGRDKIFGVDWLGEDVRLLRERRLRRVGMLAVCEFSDFRVRGIREENGNQWEDSDSLLMGKKVRSGCVERLG